MDVIIDIQQAINRKRGLLRTNTLISDTVLRRVIDKRPEANEHLTLPGCFLCDVPQSPPFLVIESLEDNLKVLWSTITKPRRLADKLLNACQFPNTLSELALARTLLDSGWSISLDEKFFRNKDSDIVARRGDEENFIEVTNLAFDRMPENGVFSTDVIWEANERTRIVGKISQKFWEKFDFAVRQGWQGRTWIAIDITKNDVENIQAFLHDRFQPGWRRKVAELVHAKCPALTGIIIYRYYPNDGPVVREIECWTC